MGGSSPLHLLLGPAAPATGVGGRPGPGSALGPPPSRQRPPWGCWAWWWWLGGVEPPVTGLYGLVSPKSVPHVRSPCSAWRRKSKHRRSEGGMAMAPWRTPGRRVHSEPTRRPIVRSAALKGAEAERWLQRSLLRSTIQWTRAWPSLLLAGGKRAPFSRRPSLTPESTTNPEVVERSSIHH